MSATSVLPITADTWPDLVELFGNHGACGGCWCMWWRTTRPTYSAGAGNRDALRDAVASGEHVGLLAYADDPASDGRRVVGWCAVAPRVAYPRLGTAVVGRGGSNDPDRWAVPCFFVRPGHRRRGLTDALLEAACAYGRTNGAAVMEGYPSTSSQASASDLYVGTSGLFERHGFVMVREPTPKRAVMERAFARS